MRFKLPVLLFVPMLLLGAAVHADSEIEREFDLAAGGEFLLDAANGSVNVQGVSGSKARIRITSRRDDLDSRYETTFDVSPGRLEVTVERKGASKSSWFNWSNGSGLRFEIEVPYDTQIDIDTAGGSIDATSIRNKARLDTSGGSIRAREIGGDLLADTSGGSIRVSEVDGNVNADTSGGSISVEGVRGTLRADTSGGTIEITDVSDDIEADTSGGSIRIERAGGRVVAGTSGGSIAVSFASGNSSGGYLSTSGGGIKVRLDTSSSLDIDAVASGGSVKTELPVSVRGRISRGALSGQMNGGGPALKLRTSGGTIRIDAL